jgi:glucose/arabinose dehydrogenase
MISGRLLFVTALLASFHWLPSTVSAQVLLPPGFALEEVHPQVNFPTCIRFSPDGRLFFTELSGRVAYFPSLTFPNSVTWTTLNVASGGERGALGLAFHPNYPDSPYVYVVYTAASPLNDRLVRYVDQLGEGKSPAILFENSGAEDFHHGGRVAFGPDGQIYLTYGDQLDPAAAQSITDRRGKIFRLGRGGKPAPGNPFGPQNPAALYGIRNAYGLCFDPLEGTGYFTDNGPECDDEINLLTFGTNYGWGPNDDCNGTPSGTRAPLAYINPTIGITGCCVYRGGVYPSRWDGALFYGAVNTGLLYRARFVAGRPDLIDTLDVFADFHDPVLDVTVGPDGFLWVATMGRIWRISYTPPVVGVGDPRGVSAAPTLRIGPNPFRTNVAFEIENAAAGARVEVMDVQGRHIQSWSVESNRRLQWDGRSARGDRVPPGIYLVRLTTADRQITQRIIRVGS